MSDNTNDTYVAPDGNDDPTLWLKVASGPHVPLLAREELRIAMGVNPFGPAVAHVDRLWAAIAATAGPAPEEEL